MAMSVAEPNTSLLWINVTFIESCAMLVRVKHQLVSAILCNISIKLLFWGTSLMPTTVFPKIHMDVIWGVWMLWSEFFKKLYLLAWWCHWLLKQLVWDHWSQGPSNGILHKVPALSILIKVGTEVGKRGFLYDWHSNTSVSNVILMYLWFFLDCGTHSYVYLWPQVRWTLWEKRGDRSFPGSNKTIFSYSGGHVMEGGSHRAEGQPSSKHQGANVWPDERW